MQHVSFPPVTTEDPDRLTQQFPKWLEKVSSRIPGGIVLVIDAADHCQVFNILINFIYNWSLDDCVPQKYLKSDNIVIRVSQTNY